jgi:hypothetical protein
MVGSRRCHDQFYTHFDSFSEPAHGGVSSSTRAARDLVVLVAGKRASEAATGHTTTALQGPCGRGGAGARVQRSAAALPPLCARVAGNQNRTSVRRSRRSPGGIRSGGRRQRPHGVSPADQMRGAPAPFLLPFFAWFCARQLSAAAHAAMYMPKPDPSTALALHTDARWGPADSTACAALWHRRRHAERTPCGDSRAQGRQAHARLAVDFGAAGFGRCSVAGAQVHASAQS